MIFRQRNLDRLILGVTGNDNFQIAGSPTQHMLREFRKFTQFRDQFIMGITGKRIQKTLMIRNDISIDMRLRRE
jgi:hypothetical protein